MILEIENGFAGCYRLGGRVLLPSWLCADSIAYFTVDDPVIPLLNVLGGVALIYSLAWNFNLGSFISQVAWLVITVFGYIRFRMVSRRRAALPQE